MYKKNLKKIKYSNYFLFIISIIILLTLFLLIKCSNFYIFIYLITCLLMEISLFIVIIKNRYDLMDIFHNLYLFLVIFGGLYLKNIYLLAILFLLFIAYLTREIFDVCLFYSYKKKDFIGTIGIFVLFCVIIFRIYNENMYNNLLKF